MPQSPDEFAANMQRIADQIAADPEIAHTAADDLLCEVLSQLGYKAGVEIFNTLKKWYA